MIHPRILARQRAAVQRIEALIRETTRSEAAADEEHRATLARIKREADDALEAAEKTFSAEQAAAEADHDERMLRIENRYRADHDGAVHKYETSKRGVTEKATLNEKAARKSWDEERWVTETVYEAKSPQPRKEFEEVRSQLATVSKDLSGLLQAACARLREYKMAGLANRFAERLAQAEEATEDGDVDEAAETARGSLARLRGLGLAKLLLGPWLILLVIALGVGAAVVTAWQRQWQIDAVPAIVGGSVLGAAIIGAIVLYVIARKHAAAAMERLCEDAASCSRRILRATEIAAEEREKKEQTLRDKRVAELERAKAKYEPILGKIAERREAALARIEGKYPAIIKEFDEAHERDVSETQARRGERVDTAQRSHDEAISAIERTRDEGLRDAEARNLTTMRNLETNWHDGTNETLETLDETGRLIDSICPLWDDTRWSTWAPPVSTAPAIRLGSLAIDLTAVEGGLPRGDTFVLPRPQLTIPAALEFPDACSLLIETDGEGRDAAIETLQATMFRLLTALPPGKARFCIIDPVGLGQSFAGFMHLTDFEEALVGDRIWTESRHIEKRLADLTEHMENVIQKYLRNQFETIGEYNEQAGEIAEPYRFLVIADFPANFNEIAGRRLASIASSGARCGVYTLIARDVRQALPEGVLDDDLRENCKLIRYRDGRFAIEDDDYRDRALSLDAAPPTAFLTDMLNKVGAAAVDSNRVEVPFASVAPPPDEYWTGSTARDLRVPLGRSGATKLQYATLGRGTSQHMLIAGKTGSGKSTLLHVMITNLTLQYSPDEVEFYLVDFKKGVEFKTYATHEVPHARAIAIESDREFGLSVLQRVDGELKRRGELFRDLGVQDLGGYRDSGHPEAMPRVLLIIDEFQEFFVDDDKLGQDAALLLDRLVRQGRAFGIHVVLGSQTLGGGYSLGRATIGQMAIRIALQCNEADAMLIMDDDNTAPRLLSRPGEALYNDAGGKVEGNSPFQIVWLPEYEREQFLTRVRDMAAERGGTPRETIVFEGNVPSQIERNRPLVEAIDGPEPAALAPAALAWMGEPVAIKAPTAVRFRRHSGSNLLIVGQRDESALALVTSSLTSLAAQHAPADARFLVLDGTPADSALHGTLSRATEHLPHDVIVADTHDFEAPLLAIGDELARRQAENRTDGPGIFVMIYGLQRFRPLRRKEDDFSFSMSEEEGPPAPDKVLTSIVREGAAFGIHLVIWVDTGNNLERAFDRQSLREFDNRVLYQMSAGDSSNLIDSPLASHLGMHRALLFTEEFGEAEKFRPYALPEHYWLREVGHKLADRLVRPAPPRVDPVPPASDGIGGDELGLEGSEIEL